MEREDTGRHNSTAGTGVRENVRSRREQLQAYRFVTRRIGSALLCGEPESNDLPMRRLGLSVFGSVMIAVLAVAAVGVIGFLNPSGNTSWKNEQSITIEKETGSRLVYQQGKLHPALNFTSALLAVGQPNPTINTVSRNSLAGVPRGDSFGIPGAPDSLPSSEQLVNAPWTVCTGNDVSDVDSQLYVGVAIGLSAGGKPLGDSGVLVSPQGSQELYLLWHGERLRVPNAYGERAALGWASAEVVQVGAAFLNAVPAGPDLVEPTIANNGQPGPAIEGTPTKIGQVFQIGTTAQYLTVLPDGLAPLGETAAKLLLGGRTPTSLDPSTYAQHHSSTAEQVPTGYPDAVPRLEAMMNGPTASVCAMLPKSGLPKSGLSTSGGNTVQLFAVSSTPAGFSSQNSTASATNSAEPTANRIVVPGGRGAIVRDLPATGVTTGTLYLITDTGMRFPIGSPADLAALGYTGVDPQLVPTNVLSLLPTGPTLSAAAARNPATTSANNR
ncbi:type VII secretion protein EccB [Fodinicola feengrottensis]|uniref:Type VII secretion protein EccB n=1 Tax=Fodinicola feengrottensis TaxID=435914 RepID=A0ABN2I6D2_9ACTN